jgi:hypothetical protein
MELHSWLTSIPAGSILAYQAPIKKLYTTALYADFAVTDYIPIDSVSIHAPREGSDLKADINRMVY